MWGGEELCWCRSDTVGDTEVNCVFVCGGGDVLSVVQIQWIVLS